jgi:predicted  nucleic acid-binding Zn-ribbon protein
MSKLGKILLWVALAGAIVGFGVGGALILKYNDAKVILQNALLAKEASDQKIVKDKAEYDDLTAAKAESDKELAAANAQVDDIKTQLSTATKQLSDSTTALSTANDAVKAAQDKLDAINQALGGKPPEQIVAEEAKAQSDLQAAQAEQKILQDQFQASQAQISDLQDAIKRSPTGTQPPGISGKVTFVDHAWNFVILNVGYTNGVVPNGELIVYRGGAFLGKVKVTKTEANDAVAEILPDVKGNIQVGDSVLN